MTLTRTIAVAALGFLGATFSAAAQDLENGAAQYRKCKTCHDLGDGAKNKTGPVLNGIIGRKVGSVEGFNYSASLKGLAADGLTWTDDKLDKYIADPKSVVPNGSMAFAGIKDKEDRADLIAYLKKGGK
ncbi:MAG: cytochrome c family protein [Hyphomicrobiales bacterium]|nr:MAG: cytochrome c family protein [Hyphomicrobiales bacterium]